MDEPQEETQMKIVHRETDDEIILKTSCQIKRKKAPYGKTSLIFCFLVYFYSYSI